MPMAGGKAPKRKGDGFEREVCRVLGGERTFWQPGQEKKPDCVSVPYLGTGECKRRRNSFSRLYNWLENVDFLAIRDDRKPMLIVMRAEDLKLILDEMDELKRRFLHDSLLSSKTTTTAGKTATEKEMLAEKVRGTDMAAEGAEMR